MARKSKIGSGDFVKALGLLSQIAITIIACIALGILIGWLLDRWLGTSPWLMMVCIFLGMGAALKSIFDFSKRI
ncbi:MAG: AtpZ/AtpI family protein [Oscillospiraceae bacterium]|nr:AtpZ/AtpI family protein [Oscillospiraceae bacterium]